MLTRTLALVTLLAAGSSVRSASAQAAAPVPDPDPGPPATLGPTVAPTPPDALIDMSSEEWRAATRLAQRRLRDIRRLEAAMAREGTTFSPDRHARYRRIMSGGVILIPLGAVSAVTGVALLIASAVAAPSEYYGDDPDLVAAGYYNDYQHEKHERSHRLLVGGAVAMAGGGALIGAGVVLVVAGRSGMKRQNLLERKDEILGPPAAARIELGLAADPRSGLLGLRLRVAL